MPDRTSAIVLAAGSGSRFGGGKSLASFQGKPLLQHVLDRIADAGLDEVVVVLGRDADAVERALAWRTERRVRNPNPERGLASSLLEGMAALDPAIGAALILLGDQPLVSSNAIRALLAAPIDASRPIVVPRYSGDDGRNPVLIRRAAFDLANDASGDRGLWPILARHPGLVQEVIIDGMNPDIDTPGDLARALEAAWRDRVLANRAQVERIREVPDGQDFYAPVRSLFRAEPTRTDDPVLAVLLDLVRPGDAWLDIGAGAGRFALPIAMALDPSGGSVIALDPSSSMLEALREIVEDYAIENVRTVETRWPPADPARFESDVALIAHVGYDIEAIGPFLGALEAAARRVCIAVLMARVPASAADPFWPPVHGESRVALPALPEFVELLRARGAEPSVRNVIVEARHFESRDALDGFVRRQLWIDPSGPKEARFQQALDELASRDDAGWTLRDRPPSDVGIVTWSPVHREP
jgi:CTP:molybdopterin cytidylyltransferase MocA/SAM-dependent methyltransferase